MRTLAIEVLVTGHTVTNTISMAVGTRFLYTATSKDREMLIWDKSSRALVGTVPAPDLVSKGGLHTDGRHLYVAERKPPILTKYTPEGEEVEQSPLPASVGLHGDDRFLYFVTGDRTLNVIDKSDLRVVAKRPVGAFKGFRPAVCCDADHAYVAAPMGEIHVFAKDGLELVAHTRKGARSARKAVVVEDRLYVACGDCRIRVFDRRTLARLAILSRERAVIRDITTDDRYLYSVGYAGTLMARDKFTGEDRLIVQHGRDCHTVLADMHNVYIGLGRCDVMVLDRAALHDAAEQATPSPAVLGVEITENTEHTWQGDSR
ncbi:hypothetical protein CMK11_21730 [Candidatus Poribacteria bacterium]|nr:hypothetical protein [Candidatus Poribacteria bacterium]